MSIPVLSGIGNFLGSAAAAAGNAVRAGEHYVGLGLGQSPTDVLNQYANGTALMNSKPVSYNAPSGGATPADVSASGGGTGGGAAGGSTGGTSGAAPATPATNANGGQSNFASTTFGGVLGQIQNAYNGLFGTNGQQGTYQNALGSAEGNLAQNYGAQQSALDANFGQAQNQMPWELVGRGANNSSWADNNVNYAQQQQQNSTNQLNANEQSAQAGLVGQMNQTQGQYGADIANYNSPTYQSYLNQAPSYIQGEEYSQAAQNLANLAGTAGANQSIPAELQQIQNIPAYQQTGGNAIASQLQALAGSPTTQAAQNQIAQGIVGNPTNPGAPSVWSNYYQQLQQNPNTPIPQGY